MKKLLKFFVFLVLLAAAALFGVSFYIGSIIKAGVETIGPKVTQVPVTLGGADLSLIGGSGGMRGLTVGNPPGYKSDAAIKVGKISIAVEPKSVLADKIIVRSIELRSPEITLEGGLTENNLTRIQKNITSYAGSGAQKADEHPADPHASKAAKSAGKKLQVDDFIISGAKVNALVLGKSVSETIPDIHLTNLGQGPEGITASELSSRALNKIITAALAAAAKGELKNTLSGKGIGNLLKGK